MVASTVQGDRLIAGDDTVLYMNTWREESSELKAIVYFVHGLGEHIHLYEDVFTTFTSHGIRVHAFDQRGHGRTFELNKHTMTKAHLGDLQNSIADVKALMGVDKDVRVPKFLMGHSMGGLIVTMFALQEKNHGLRGVIASAPAYKQGQSIPKLKEILGKFFSHLLPSFTISPGLSIANISHNTAIMDAFLADPLCTSKISLKTASSILAEGQKIREMTNPIIDASFLLVHGDADIITCPESSKLFIEKLSCSDKTLEIYPDGYHCLHHDTAKDKVIQDYISWIEKRLSN